jgi:hypothetical protein
LKRPRRTLTCYEIQMNPHTEQIILGEIDQLVVANEVLTRMVDILAGKLWVLQVMFSEEHKETWNHIAGLVETLPHNERAPFQIERGTANAPDNENHVV